MVGRGGPPPRIGQPARILVGARRRARKRGRTGRFAGGSMKTSRIAVVGGGPGGLFTSYLLEEYCGDLCEVTLFEAGPRLGGKVLTRHSATAPVLYEAGVAELYDYSRSGPDPLRELVEKLGLSTVP